MKKVLSIILISIIFTSLNFGCGKTKKEEKYDMNNRVALNKNEQEYTFEEKPTYSNYMNLTLENGNITEVGDPFIMRWNGKYYLYPSARNLGVLCFVSDDLVNWSKPVVVAPLDEYTSNGYAPEVVYYNGSFYMCESQGGKGHYIFKADNPLGPFTRISGNLLRGIDGSFYVDGDGELYFMHTSTASGLSYAKVNDIEGGLKEESEVFETISRTINSATSSMNGWTEGPGVFRRGDYYYLTYTGNHVSSIGYKVAYSYLKADKIDYTKFESLEDQNITLINTSEGKGISPGHSSDFIGPNLDGIWTGYHTHGPTRMFNLAQYFTNGAILQANGYPNYTVDVPDMPDFSAENAEGLYEDGRYTLAQTPTQSLYTAEFNFKIRADGNGGVIVGYTNENNYTAIKVENNLLYVIKVVNGKSTELAHAEIPAKNCSIHTLNTLRVENGFNKCYVTFNGMRLITLNKSLDGGKLGYDENVSSENIFYTAYTNDSFGTSDFESVKNLPSSFPAYTYLKGENRGFYIKNAKVKADGVRQGEKESTKENELYTSVVLDSKEDYVKYAVNAKRTGKYRLLAYVNKNCVGAIAEAVVDSADIYKLQVPSVALENPEDDYVLVDMGTFEMTEGKHTLKIRLFSGKLDVVSFKINDLADSYNNGYLQDDLTEEKGIFKLGLGSNLYTFDGGLVTKDKTPYGNKIFMTAGNDGVADYEVSVDMTLSSGESGILVRAKNYSYHNAQTSYAFQGYYISLNVTGAVKVFKYNYGRQQYYVGFLTDENGEYYSSAEGKTFRLKVVAKGNSVSVYIDGQRYCTINDDYAFYNGGWGFYSENSVTKFANLEYKEI